MKYPIEPLERLFVRDGECEETQVTGQYQGRPSIRLIADRCGVSRSTVCRWRAEGVPFWAADQVACAVGVHPSAIWPDWRA